MSFALKFLLLVFNHSVMSDSLQLHRLQHSRFPCPSLSSGVCSNPCPLNHWCHPIISSSVVPFSSCLQSWRINWKNYYSFVDWCVIFSDFSSPSRSSIKDIFFFLYWWTYLKGRNRDTDTENRCVNTVREGDGVTNWESSIETYTIPCKIDS